MKLLRLDLTHMLECLECVSVHVCVGRGTAVLLCLCVSHGGGWQWLAARLRH